jgi:hypothetical protein
MIDYTAMLADLRRQRDEIAAVIAALEPLAAKAPAPAAPRTPKPAPQKKESAATAQPEPVLLYAADAKAKAIALSKEGKTPKEIAAAVKRPYATVYGWLAKAGLAGPKKKGGDATRRLCAECGQKGISDPCEHCGEAR